MTVMPFKLKALTNNLSVRGSQISEDLFQIDYEMVQSSLDPSSTLNHPIWPWLDAFHFYIRHITDHFV